MERIPESTLLVHLHNALVQKGYIQQPIGLYRTYEDLFAKIFFADGKVPTDNFEKHLLAALAGDRLPRPSALRRGRDTFTTRAETPLQRAANLKTKSYLMACQEAGWNPDRIPDRDVPVASMLGGYRMMHTPFTVDPVTGEKRLDDTDLVQRLRADGMTDKQLLTFHHHLRPRGPAGLDAIPEHLLKSLIPEGHTVAPSLEQSSMSGYGDITSKDLLAFLKNDIYNDICGSIPMSSLNYVWVMCRFFGQFMQFEDAFSEVGNATYIQAYETDPGYRSHKRTGLVYLALKNNDEECLEFMAEEFERFRLGFMNHIYWDDLDSEGLLKSAMEKDEDDEPGRCTVM